MPTIADLVRDAYANWEDAPSLSRLGCELHDRNRLDVAREVLERALQLNDQDAEAWAHLAYAHLRGYRPDRGLDILREGIRRTGSDKLRSTLAGFTQDEQERGAIRDALAASEEPAVQAGVLASRHWAGDAEAFGKLRTVLEEHPNDADVRDSWLWVLIGTLSRPGGDAVDVPRDGIPVADQVIAADPDRVGGHWKKAQLLNLSKNWDGLLEATEQALESFPDEETMMFLRGSAFKAKGDLERAAGCFARAIGMKPSFVGARSALGETYEGLDRTELAEEVFRESLVANPEFAGGAIALAQFLARRGRWEEAETLFLESWTKLAPWQQARVRQQPGAAVLLERERIRAAVGDGPA